MGFIKNTLERRIQKMGKRILEFYKNTKYRIMLIILIGCVFWGQDISLKKYAFANPLMNICPPINKSISLPNDGSDSVKKILLLLSRTQGTLDNLNIDKIFNKYKTLNQDDYRWPLYTFIFGEMYWFREDKEMAHNFYNELIHWADKNPNQKSGLVVVALWRDLLIRNEKKELESNSKADEFIKIAKRIIKTNSAKRMFHFHFHSALPKLEEEILKLSAKLAWTAKFKKSKDKARSLFLDYLLIASTSELDEIEKEIKADLLNLISHERLNLMIAKRLKSQKNIKTAEELLLNLYEKGKNTQIRAEAGFHLAEIIKDTKERAKEPSIEKAALEKRKEILDFVINYSSDQSIVQKAYLLLAKNQDDETYENEHIKLLNRFPQGEYADKALAKLARHYWHKAKKIKAEIALNKFDQQELAQKLSEQHKLTEKALDTFEELRNFKANNNWKETSLFVPALILYSEATQKDSVDKNKIKEAIRLLEKEEKENPWGDLSLATFFWLGRMYEEIGDEKSTIYFNKAIKRDRYHYYGIRSQIHLNVKTKAIKLLWGDPVSKKLWKGEYLRNVDDTSILKKKIDSPYYTRLLEALKTGLYDSLIEFEDKKRKQGQRLEELSLNKLDEDGSLTIMSLLLALRQDAFAAAKDAPDMDGRLAIANLLKCSDTFLAIRVINERMPKIQERTNYLPVAYPKVFHKQVIAGVESYKDVRPELLYSVMKHESFFFSSAFSVNQAVGLFQFIPSTFEMLNKEWNLLKEAKVATRESYLFDTNLNIHLGTRWFERLLKKHDKKPLWALMNHSARDKKVEEWKQILTAEGKDDDIEYAIESIDYPQTRSFLREVIANMVILDAIELYK